MNFEAYPQPVLAMRGSERWERSGNESGKNVRADVDFDAIGAARRFAVAGNATMPPQTYEVRCTRPMQIGGLATS